MEKIVLHYFDSQLKAIGSAAYENESEALNHTGDLGTASISSLCSAEEIKKILPNVEGFITLPGNSTQCHCCANFANHSQCGDCYFSRRYHSSKFILVPMWKEGVKRTPKFILYTNEKFDHIQAGSRLIIS